MSGRVGVSVALVVLLAGAGLPGAPRSQATGPPALPCDFDGDGFSELAIGVQNESIGLSDQAGMVNVLPGSAGGLTAAGDQVWHQASTGVPGAVEPSDRLGVVACGDFDGDGNGDMAVGIPEEDIGDHVGAGAVLVLYGTDAGLAADRSQLWHQGSEDIRGALESFDRFGSSVVAGDFNGDGVDDLAVGVRGEAIGTEDNAGAVNVIYGSPAGLTSAGNQLWHQDSPGIASSAEKGDYFSGVNNGLAAGDLNEDGIDDLVVAASEETAPGPGNLGKLGAVHVIYGSESGLTSAGSQLLHVFSGGEEGTYVGPSPVGDFGFGASVIVGDFDGDSYGELALGVLGPEPGEGGGEFWIGAVFVFDGSAAGLVIVENEVWWQGTPGVAGKPEAFDRFGYALAAGDFDSDGHDDLAVGVPGEDLGSISGGMVNLIYGSADGLVVPGNHSIHQNSLNVAGTAEQGDFFGGELSTGDFDGDGYLDLVVGVPFEDIGSIANAGAVQVFYGMDGGLSGIRDTFWHQNAPGVKGKSEQWDTFGGDLNNGQ